MKNKIHLFDLLPGEWVNEKDNVIMSIENAKEDMRIKLNKEPAQLGLSLGQSESDGFNGIVAGMDISPESSLNGYFRHGERFFLDLKSPNVLIIGERVFMKQ